MIVSDGVKAELHVLFREIPRAAVASRQLLDCVLLRLDLLLDLVALLALRHDLHGRHTNQWISH